MSDIKSLYYDIEKGYKSAEKLKKENPELHRKQLQEFIKNQHVDQVLKQYKKPKHFNSIVAYKNRDNYQMDVLVYNRYEFHKYRYILVVIDVHSRYAEARAMTNVTGENLLNNIKEIFNSMGLPKNLNCDN